MSAPTSLPLMLLKGAQNMITQRSMGTFEQVESKIGHAYLSTPDGRNTQVLLFIPNLIEGEIEKVKNEQVNYLFYLMNIHNVFHAIVPFSAVAPQAFDILRSHVVYRVELFKFKHLLFDPTAHQKTPKHFFVHAEDVPTELPGKSVKDLPRILVTDPIMRFYDRKIGDVIRIERTDGIYYRVVV